MLRIERISHISIQWDKRLFGVIQMDKNAQIEEARNTLIGRLFTLGGSVLFLIGSLIIAILGYNTYTALLHS